MKSDARRDAAIVVAVALVALLLACYSLGVGWWNLSVPWSGGDLIDTYADARAMLQNGWVTPNPDLGYPFFQDKALFPRPDFLYFGLLKILVLITGNAIAAVNLFFVLGFPLVALASYALFRVVRISPWIAGMLALSFALLPWHFVRVFHVFLSNYLPVAFGLLVLALVCSSRLDRSWREPKTRNAGIAALLLALCVGLSGAYFAVFMTLLILPVLTAQIALGRRQLRESLRSIELACVIPATLVLASLANKAFVLTSSDGSVAARNAIESQMYGGAFFTMFRVAKGSLLSSVPSRRLGDLAISSINQIEGDALNSIVGVIAVVVTVLLVFLKWGTGTRMQRVRPLLETVSYWPAIFLLALLWFVTGGLGSLFAVLATAQIRAWGRMSVVMICIALIVLGLALTWWARNTARRWPFVTAVAVLAILTFADPLLAPRRLDTAAAEASQQDVSAYVAEAERQLNPGCPVLELPVMRYPEPGLLGSSDPPINSNLLPYLYSENLRWSFGAIKGSDAGNWSTQRLSKDPVEVIKQAKAAGFCAIQVDNYGEPTRSIPYRELIGAPIARSATGRWVMFDLAGVDPAPVRQ